jgi:hypothetical protein
MTLSSFLIRFIAPITLSLIAGFRLFGIDRDYYDYLLYHDSFINPNYVTEFRFEYGFYLLTKFIIILNENLNFYLSVVALIPLYLKFYLLDKAKSSFYFIFLYLLMIYPLHEMTQIRAALSIGFFYFAFYYLISNKFFKVFLFLFISVLFHYSILVFLFIFIIINFLLINKKNFLFSDILFILGIIFLIYLFAHDLSFYFNIGSIYFSPNSDSANFFSLRVFLFLLIILIGIINFRYILNGANYWFYISLSGLIFYYSLFNYQILACRFLEISYFSYFLWINYLPKKACLLAKFLLFIISILSFWLMFFENSLFN